VIRADAGVRRSKKLCDEKEDNSPTERRTWMTQVSRAVSQPVMCRLGCHLTKERAVTIVIRKTGRQGFEMPVHEG
jgi:hypothetical protein